MTGCRVKINVVNLVLMDRISEITPVGCSDHFHQAAVEGTYVCDWMVLYSHQMDYREIRPSSSQV